MAGLEGSAKGAFAQQVQQLVFTLHSTRAVTFNVNCWHRRFAIGPNPAREVNAASAVTGKKVLSGSKWLIAGPASHSVLCCVGARPVSSAAILQEKRASVTP